MKCILTTLIALASLSNYAQENNAQQHPEYEAIMTILNGYLDAIYNADSTIVETITNENLQKSGMYLSRQNQKWSYEHMNFAELQHTAATYNIRGWIPEKAPHQAEVYDIGEKIATAKVTAIWGFDYILLRKQDGLWGIDKILWQSFTNRDILQLQLKNAYKQADKSRVFLENENPQQKTFKGCFDGDSVFYYFALEDKRYSLMRANLKNGILQNAIPFRPAELNASYLYPAVSPDGKYLLYTTYSVGGSANTSIWMCRRNSDGWGVPEKVKNINKEGLYHSNLSFDAAGNFIYRVEDFKSDTNMTLIAVYKNGTFKQPQPYLPVEQFKDQLKDVHIWGGTAGPTSNSVILDISLIDLYGKKLPSSQWISTFEDGRWSLPRPIGNGLNTALNWESFVFYNGNRDTLYFTREFNDILSIPVDYVMN